jgi:hypothetical protein
MIMIKSPVRALEIMRTAITNEYKLDKEQTLYDDL